MGRDDPDKLQDWATEWQKILDDQLYIFHNIIIEGSPSLIEKLKENSEFQVNEDDIHTETVARLVTDYFRTLTAEQTKGYELLFQANNYLYGASGNNDIYKLMVERFHEQGEKFKTVLEDSKSLDQYLIRFDDYNVGDTFAMNDHRFVHLDAVEADEGKVVTGFQLYYKGNRLVVKIKQGTLREMGVIDNNDWKSEDSYSWNNIHGENYIKYFDAKRTKKTDYHYIDFGFYQADVGRTIVGIKFCIENNRVALCVKTMKVDFASGTLSDKSDWEHTPKKWGDQAHVKVDYMSSQKIRYVSKREVESNPVGMLTGVGLFWDPTSCGSRCAAKHKPLAIRANDYFEPEEKGEYCGQYSNYRMEEGKDINPACCGDYIYNKNAQVCNDQQIGPLFIDCGDTPTKSTNKIQCADGEEVEVTDGSLEGCTSRGSHIFRCPFPLIPCENLKENGKEFQCDKTCSEKGGKRKTCIGDMKCIAAPRKDKNFLRCADGELGYNRNPTKWEGCRNQNSVRIQCPQDHFPCNALTGNASHPEF